ncbi:phosphate regulon transcriptional regulator PhoB [Aliikangiella sp. G2MR2-5]|uniref:phosphate regulon transcriptional regulator PhoB n=1 Tax=Aliikangiella sp. G2MR2-5 TaxID=2788943 RepID=UPI0018ABF152|nr:phosphate regulon transcriptional regulator PhoB [Aliikangiella sp. G2MR2-5]
MSKKLLLVDDEQPIREMLRYAFEKEGYQIEEAESAKQAREIMSRKRPDLAIVDWMMPGESGVELVRSLRKDELYTDLPVIMLTARVEEKDKVKGLDYGADDYLTKPVGIKELMARVRAILRRSSHADEDDQLVAEGLTLNLATKQLSVDGEEVHIGQTEFSLLQFFIEHQNRVYSRAQLLDFVWGQAVYIEERTVDVHILRLRKILKPFGKDKLVKTVRGMGYMFTTKSKAAS